jgi:hypothetical protein
VVKTEDFSASLGTLTIFGARVLSLGSYPALALNSFCALANSFGRAASLLK